MGLVADVISIGVDLGQRIDPTAIAAARITERQYDRLAGTFATPETLADNLVTETFYDVRWLERQPLETPYRTVGMRLVEMIRDAYALPPVYDEASGLPGTFAPILPREVRITIDSTGVGVAAIETLVHVLEGAPKHSIIPVMITSGFQKRWAHHGQWSGWNVGKAAMVSRLVALLQKPPHIGLPPDHKEREQITAEIQSFHVRVSRDGHDTYGAPESTGAHDDYVTALALCCLDDPAQHLVTMGPKIW